MSSYLPSCTKHHYLRRFISKKPVNPILIYQMGKVGSSSISDSFRRINYSVGSLSTVPKLPTPYDVVHTHIHDVAAEYLSNRDSSKKQRIITGVRDILKRNISAFFQNMSTLNSPFWYFGNIEKIKDTDVKDLIEFFNERQSFHFRNVIEPWFDHFAEVVGVDVYEREFPTDIGYMEIDSHVNIFIYRAENLPLCSSALSRFSGEPKLIIDWANKATDKWYRDLYADFIKKYRPSSGVISSIYNSKIMCHFYSEEEINSFKSHWF